MSLKWNFWQSILSHGLCQLSSARNTWTDPLLTRAEWDKCQFYDICAPSVSVCSLTENICGPVMTLCVTICKWPSVPSLAEVGVPLRWKEGLLSALVAFRLQDFSKVAFLFCLQVLKRMRRNLSWPLVAQPAGTCCSHRRSRKPPSKSSVPKSSEGGKTAPGNPSRKRGTYTHGAGLNN